ncbi:MAG: DUF6273 domain-containing protein, partial [Clostridiales bacterium]|nr:DUF6273 domain-containing protein [Clostridiales bacterium]
MARKYYLKTSLKIILSIALLLSSICMMSFTSFGEDSDNPVAGKSVGDTITFGSYPQTQVTDTSLISELDSLDLNWISYGYYYGTDEEGSEVQGDYMQYCDVEYDGCMYRGVCFSEYRPQLTYEPTKYVYSYSYWNGYETNITYWFKYEPITWIVLDPDEGFVISSIVLDSQPFNNVIYEGSDGEYYVDEECTAYACDYEASYIRSWLNDNFYNVAFTSAEKEYIETSELENGIHTSGTEQYIGANTEDKVFILSYDEITNSNYGLTLTTSKVIATTTNYARIQGVQGYSTSDAEVYWWIRTVSENSNDMLIINHKGVFNSKDVNMTSIGVRPAIKFVDNVQHNYVETVTEPTCTEKGYTTYTCTV